MAPPAKWFPIITKKKPTLQASHAGHNSEIKGVRVDMKEVWEVKGITIVVKSAEELVVFIRIGLARKASTLTETPEIIRQYLKRFSSNPTPIRGSQCFHSGDKYTIRLKGDSPLGQLATLANLLERVV